MIKVFSWLTTITLLAVVTQIVFGAHLGKKDLYLLLPVILPVKLSPFSSRTISVISPVFNFLTSRWTVNGTLFYLPSHPPRLRCSWWLNLCTCSHSSTRVWNCKYRAGAGAGTRRYKTMLFWHVTGPLIPDLFLVFSKFNCISCLLFWVLIWFTF